MSRPRANRGAEEFVLVVSPSRRAAGRARDAVRRRLAKAVPAAALTDLVTVVSELVNNAVQHGPGRPITISLVVGEDSVRGEVADQGNPSASIPQIREATESKGGARPDGGGLGLTLVDKLTADWAVYEGSTHVWFELPLE